MARLPQPGGDQGDWGDILNSYLLAAHNDDGTLKNTGILAEKYTMPSGGIPMSDLTTTVQQAITSASGADGREVEFQLSATHIQWRYVGTATWTNLVPLTDITGPQGPTGVQGTQGATGPQGVQGMQGATGPEGPTGLQGATGPEGPAGTDGTSVTILGSYATENEMTTAHPTGALGDAYMVAGDLYVWTGSAWDNVGPIQGPEGPQGATGPQGVQGVTGATGAQGTVGAAGATGPQGPTGTQGATGPQGAAGATGQDGADGVGVPTGGAAGQVLAKASSTNYDTEWVAQSGGDQLVNFSQAGLLTTGTGQGRFVFPMAITVEGVMATVGTAPTGSAVTIDVNRNGTSIFTTQANRPSIAAGATISTQATPNTTSLSAGQYLTVDIDQVGSSTAGSDLTVVIRYRAA